MFDPVPTLPATRPRASLLSATLTLLNSPEIYDLNAALLQRATHVLMPRPSERKACPSLAEES